ncbi:MAG: 23S rRNA pseudouridine(1911/1915/1917) synthase RluD [Gammaproteobacteria bacterium]|nr:23S rRNA pseudouridine(1911/1915/1917) synthase RluD [Gammaproteobacteria bacterium]
MSPNRRQAEDQTSTAETKSSHRRLTSIVPDDMTGLRLDQALSQLFPEYSRARLQSWIGRDLVRVNGAQRRQRDRVQGGEHIEIDAVLETEETAAAEDIPLNIVYEDEALLVLDKPVGLVVHPGAGNRQGTMLNALLHHVPTLETVPRAGIIHRIDKDTSGLLVVAKTLEAHTDLVDQLQQRLFHRVYQTVVWGVLPAGGEVDAPIGRHPQQRTRMAVTQGGREAITHYRVIERFRGHSLLSVRLETGRTHQIRVHMTHINHPIVGDPVYGGRLRIPKGATEALREQLAAFRRQALHAAELGLTHPLTGEEMLWQSPLPEDMRSLIECMREDCRQATRGRA